MISASYLQLSTEQFPKALILTPWPGPCSAVILDNCAIHHDEDVRQIIEVECGAWFYVANIVILRQPLSRSKTYLLITIFT